MHLYIFVRGKFEQIELWKSIAQSAFWKWRRINKKTGKEEILLVQGALRPSIFGAYEYIFPKEALTEVCAFFGIEDNVSYRHLKLSGIKHIGLRKLFGVNKIPKKILEKSKAIAPTFSTEEFERGVGNAVIPGVAVHVIGIKKDDYRYFSEFGYTQEAL